MRDLKVTPHVAQNTSNRRSAVDRRTTGHPGYAVSQRIRKRIEEAFGWIKEIALQRRALQRRARHRGKERVGRQFTLAAAAYDLIRLPKLLAVARCTGPPAADLAGQTAELGRGSCTSPPPQTTD